MKEKTSWVLVMTMCIIAIFVILWLWIFGWDWATGEELPFTLYQLEQQNLYHQSDTVNSFNKYQREKRELKREYDSQSSAPIRLEYIVEPLDDPPKHDVYVPFQD
jgi:hypothetical protein